MNDAKQKYIEFLNSTEGAILFQQFKTILYGDCDSLIEKVHKEIDLAPKNSIKILDVGGGAGDRTDSLIKIYMNEGIDAKATIIEPSPALRKQYKQNENIEFIQAKYEDADINEKYDLALFIHSIFTFKDNFYIEKTYKNLNQGGVICIVSNSPDSFLGGLKKICDKGYNVKRKEIDMVISHLKNNNFTFNIKSYDTIFESPVQDGRFTESGKTIMRWICMENDYMKIPDEVKKSATQYFHNKTYNGKIKENETIVRITRN